MKAVLIMPRVSFYRGYEDSFGFSPIPYGLLQLGGCLISRGDQVKVIDQEVGEMSNWKVIREAMSFNPDIVGISLHATAGYKNAVAIAKGIKEQDRGVTLIAGGHHATFVPYQLLREGFDIVVRGEADETIMEIAERLEKRESLRDVRGIVYKEREGEVFEGAPRPLIQDLDKLPMPAFHLIDKRKYRIKVIDENGYLAAMETARGCPYSCDFCSVTPTWGHKWRNKSNRRILKELEAIKGLGYDWVFFVDDIFIVWPNIRQRMNLFNQMLERELKVNFLAQMRVDVTAMNPEVIKMASEAGLRVAFLGVESGSERVIKEMHKGIRSDQAFRAVKVLNDNGVIVFLGMILGAPYENLHDLISTISYSYKLSDVGADGVQFSIYTPLPGTRVFHNAISKGELFTLDWEYYDLLRPVMRTKVNPILIQLLAVLGNHTFYLRKYLKGKLLALIGKKVRIDPRKEFYLRNAERYFLKNLYKYIFRTLKLPISMIETLILMQRWKSKRDKEKEIAKEVANFSSKIVYLEEKDKNPYFNIKTE